MYLRHISSIMANAEVSVKLQVFVCGGKLWRKRWEIRVFFKQKVDLQNLASNLNKPAQSAAMSEKELSNSNAGRGNLTNSAHMKDR